MQDYGAVVVLGTAVELVPETDSFIGIFGDVSVVEDAGLRAVDVGLVGCSDGGAVAPGETEMKRGLQVPSGMRVADLWSRIPAREQEGEGLFGKRMARPEARLEALREEGSSDWVIRAAARRAARVRERAEAASRASCWSMLRSSRMICDRWLEGA